MESVGSKISTVSSSRSRGAAKNPVGGDLGANACTAEVYAASQRRPDVTVGTTPREVVVRAGGIEFQARVPIDTPGEADYLRHGGIRQYVLGSLLD
jgi:aconitase A